MQNTERAASLRKLAEEIRRDKNCRGMIAAGFDLIAEAMAPCVDCGAPDLPEAPDADKPAADFVETKQPEEPTDGI